MDIQTEEKQYSFSMKDISERYEQVPDKIRGLLVDVSIGKTIKNILAANNIPKEKLSDVLYFSSLVLLGFYHRDDFVDYLAEDLGTDSLSTQNAALEINRKVFLPYKAIIDDLYDIPLEGELEEEVEEEKLSSGEPLVVKDDKPKIEEKKEEYKKTEAFKPRIFPKGLNQAASNLKSPFSGDKMVGDIKKEEVIKPQDKKLVEDTKPEPKPDLKAKPGMILGKEMEIKPTLETASPLMSVFDEVKSKEEKVISALEVGGEKKPGLFKKFKDQISSRFTKKESPKEEKVQVPDLKKDKKEEPNVKKDVVPTKIVNFSENSLNKKPDKSFDLNKSKSEGGETEKKSDAKIDLKKIKF